MFSEELNIEMLIDLEWNFVTTLISVIFNDLVQKSISREIIERSNVNDRVCLTLLVLCIEKLLTFYPSDGTNSSYACVTIAFESDIGTCRVFNRVSGTQKMINRPPSNIRRKENFQSTFQGEIAPLCDSRLNFDLLRVSTRENRD